MKVEDHPDWKRAQEIKKDIMKDVMKIKPMQIAMGALMLELFQLIMKSSSKKLIDENEQLKKEIEELKKKASEP